jgi:AcrR family transcriptional regulator
MPKVVDHEAYRAELLEQSYAVFVKLGYAACTMRVLAQDLGVSTGALYHYFKTKEDLFEQLVQSKAAQSQAHIKGLLNGTKRPMSCRTMFGVAADMAQDRRQQQLLLMEFQRQNPKRAKNLSSLEAWSGMVAELLGISDRPLLQLVTSAMAGSMLMSDGVDRKWFIAQGELLDELLAQRSKK